MTTTENIIRSCLVVALLLPTLEPAADDNSRLADHVWIHGSEDCSTNDDPAIETFGFDDATYILRQNKCVDFEAPFIYVLFGLHTVLVLDTGATSEPGKFPLYDAIVELIEPRATGSDDLLNVMVLHSHSHGDHKAGDGQFADSPNVTVVAPNKRGLDGFLGPSDAENMHTVELGERTLTIFPVPGHQSESIAIYDPHTRWLLTGDTVYPGIISVLDWAGYISSVDRLVQFSSSVDVSAVLGSHIEMSRTPGLAYPRGTTFQPNEASLVLPVSALAKLKVALDKTKGKRQEIVSGSIIVQPVPLPMRMLIRFLKKVGVE